MHFCPAGRTPCGTELEARSANSPQARSWLRPVVCATSQFHNLPLLGAAHPQVSLILRITYCAGPQAADLLSSKA